MTRQRAPGTCTTAPGCLRTATHEFRGSGRRVGVGGKKPPPIHLLACDQHANDARQAVADREVRSGELIHNPEPGLFDIPDPT